MAGAARAARSFSARSAGTYTARRATWRIAFWSTRISGRRGLPTTAPERHHPQSTTPCLCSPSSSPPPQLPATLLSLPRLRSRAAEPPFRGAPLSEQTSRRIPDGAAAPVISAEPNIITWRSVTATAPRRSARGAHRPPDSRPLPTTLSLVSWVFQVPSGPVGRGIA